jgi:GT2 family glycosyltransferase
MNTTLSVITLCYNNLSDLIITCKSVDSQTIKPQEHLIIDGSNNDEIVNWLSQNPQPVYRRWIHERDDGISDAFNKGIINSNGKVIHLLNSADIYYTKDAIATALAYFHNDSSLMWAHSKYVQHRGQVNVICGTPFQQNKIWKGMRAIGHPTMFVKREVYDRHGLFNKEYRIAMDFDLLIRIRNEKFIHITRPLVYFSPGGVSSIEFKRGLDEVRKIYQKHFGFSFKLLLWHLRQKALQQFMQTKAGRKWFQWKNKSHQTVVDHL